MAEIRRDRYATVALLGLSVTFAIMLMTISLAENSAQFFYAAIFLVPILVFGFMMQRFRPSTQVVHTATGTGLIVMLALVTTLVPRITWQGPGLLVLVSISMVFGIAVGFLSHRAWLVTDRQTTEQQVH